MLPKIKKSPKIIYLDHAATTYLDKQVKKAMEPFWVDGFGNPSSLYSKGRHAKTALDVARSKIAAILSCRPEEIIFTAGGTESINMAIFGIAREYQYRMKNLPGLSSGGSTATAPHIITSEIEHHAVLNSFEALEKEGVETTILEVDNNGLINLEELRKAIKPNTILVSIMYANNEIGTVEPIAEIGKYLNSINEQRSKRGEPKINFHTDACQAAGALDINVKNLNVDLMSLNGSKIYGPKQTGLLFVKNSVRIRPLIYGGGQEKNLRSGTENVPGIVGLAAALEIAQKERVKENVRLRSLRNYFVQQIQLNIPKTVLNGPELHTDSEENSTRLPNNINISILDTEGEALLLYLDSYNICASTGSACTSTSLDPSHVILAIGRPYEYAHGSIRFTLGKTTTKKDIDYVMRILPGVVQELRRISPVNLNPERPAEITAEKAFVGENMDKFRNKKVKSRA